jgi:hypothetical protein
MKINKLPLVSASAVALGLLCPLPAFAAGQTPTITILDQTETMIGTAVGFSSPPRTVTTQEGPNGRAIG